jgi:hypothetical protein
MSTAFAVLALTASLGVVGCNGGDDGGGEGGSCSDYNATTECLDYTGSGWDQTSAAYHCQGMQGTYSADACDSTAALARCTISAGDPLEYYHIYYDRLVEAEQACSMNNGIWEQF